MKRPCLGRKVLGKNAVSGKAEALVKAVVSGKAAVLLPLLFMFILTLSGCLPKNYTEDDEKNIRESAKTLLEAYVKDHMPAGTVLGEIQAEMTTDDINGRYGTFLLSLAYASYENSKERGTLYVNTETKEIFVSAPLKQAGEEIASELFDTLGLKKEALVGGSLYVSMETEASVVPYSGANAKASLMIEAVPASVTDARKYLDENAGKAELSLMSIYTGEKPLKEIAEACENDTFLKLLEKYPYLTSLELVSMNKETYELLKDAQSDHNNSRTAHFTGRDEDEYFKYTASENSFSYYRYAEGDWDDLMIRFTEESRTGTAGQKGRVITRDLPSILGDAHVEPDKFVLNLPEHTAIRIYVKDASPYEGKKLIWYQNSGSAHAVKLIDDERTGFKLFDQAIWSVFNEPGTLYFGEAAEKASSAYEASKEGK